MASTEELLLPTTVGRGPMMGRVVVYSIGGCPHCQKTKALLKAQGIPFVDVSLTIFPGVRDWLRNKTGKSSVPQIFFNDHHIGGNQELQQLHENSAKWTDLLDAVWTNAPPVDGDPEAPVIPHPSEAVEQDVTSMGITCETDEDMELVKLIRKSDYVLDRPQSNFIKRCLLKSHKDTITGADLVKFIQENKSVDGAKAIEIGKSLLSKHLMTKVSKNGNEFSDSEEAIYSLVEHEQSSNALNNDIQMKCAPKPLSEFGEVLRKIILDIHAKFLSADGTSVDYSGIKKSQDFSSYKEAARHLQNVNITDASYNHRLAFFINIYNALVIHGFVERGSQPSNHFQRYLFFSRTKYNIGGHDYSLNDIENGILRGNRNSFGTLFLTPFGKNDPRLIAALTEVDPRIHFALNCGASSCPPIKTFTGDNIDKELALATESYLENPEGFDVNEENRIIHLSMLFKWFKADFGENEENVLNWIWEHTASDNAKRMTLQLLIESNNYTIKYITYNWGDNDSKHSK